MATHLEGNEPDTLEVTAAPMPSRESNSVDEERKTSSESTRMTREEAREMLAKYEEIGRRFLEYLKENNMLPKPCPAPKIKNNAHQAPQNAEELHGETIVEEGKKG